MQIKKTLKELKEGYINKVDINTLVDIRGVHIDTSLSKEERIKSYINQIKNLIVMVMTK